MGAKCHFVAFKLAVGPSVNRAVVVDAVAQKNNATCKLGGRERFVRVDQAGEYLVGRWAGFHGKNRTVVADVATREMVWNELPDGYEHTAPNYFVLHARTLHGVYQKYVGSNSLNHFGEWLRRTAVEAVREDRKAASDRAREDRRARFRANNRGKAQAAKKDREEVKDGYAVDFGPIIHPERLDDLLARWQAISAVRYKVFVPNASEAEYGPLAPHTQVAVHELRMSTSHGDVTRKKSAPGPGFGKKIADALVWLRGKYHDGLRRTTLIGTDERGQARTVNLDQYTDTLGEAVVTDVLTDTELATQDVVNSPLIAQMLALCHERPEYFGLESR